MWRHLLVLVHWSGSHVFMGPHNRPVSTVGLREYDGPSAGDENDVFTC